ncbi:flippase [Leptolyngbya iicbica LK]|uniref:Flippase n=1 Tax=Leptolyngbya iicbica LK TaxID=2294035 RepID=A0A4Q7EFF9_9CYAN|nr:flippase [Leptolyngbya sp. LK]RZM81787.1 flippase [Leptolyngbya sp. LK]
MFSKSLTQLKDKASKIRTSSLAKDSFWLLSSKGLNIFIQTAYFVILARTLGPSEYGVFVGITALATMINSFASWGCSEILVKHVSVDRSLLKYYWGNALLTVFVMGTLLTVLFTAIGPALSGGNFPPVVIALIFIADLIGFNISSASSAAFLATGQAKVTAFKSILIGFTKLLAAIALALVLEQTTSLQWAYLYCFSTMLPAILSIWMVNAWLDKPQVSIPRLKKEFVQGFYFSISQSSDFINENIDKIMLASAASLQATGLYGAGFRILTVFKIPILSVAGATFPRFFQHGAEGISGSYRFAKKLLPMAFAYGLGMAVITVVMSPYVEPLIGEGYAEIDALLKLLAPVPLLIALQIVVGDTLTGANHQSYRTSIQVFAAALNVVLNLWLIPRYSWQGAAWATLISESTKVVGFSIAIFYLHNQQSKTPKVDEEE